MKTTVSILAFALVAALSAERMAQTPEVVASDQSVANGIVSAEKIVAAENGWMVVHDMKPGPVIGYAPLRTGENLDVVAILTEEVQPGEMLMLMGTRRPAASRPAGSSTPWAPTRTAPCASTESS